ncbi:DUF806 family protein [Loigolactobacillus jiayinensis]|uniref:DUF806 family protein n=1 Tax=Loigolactobacillus jiayinensis TaxID=2486016 RepID=A0ABW1RBV2_9LACO|nr:DUF806 family protein [Loigolactobacillus jiayinensis]
MTSASYVKSILVSEIKQLPKLSVEHIHAFSIGNDSNTDDPILLITELPDYSQNYGNGQPISTKKQAQIEFYYPKDYQGDMEAIETAVKWRLLNHGLYCNSDVGHVLTPDTQNIENTLKFIYTKEEI